MQTEVKSLLWHCIAILKTSQDSFARQKIKVSVVPRDPI